MNTNEETELSNVTTSDSGVCASEASTDVYKFDASTLMDPNLTETAIEGNEWNGNSKECEKVTPLLGNEKKIKIIEKKNLSAYGDKTDVSLSIHNLYEMNGSQCNVEDVKLVWKNLSCTLNTTNFRKRNSFPWFTIRRMAKVILQEQSGSLKVGTLTAVIGPSGAGKSTFLECLSGKRRTTRKGEIYVSNPYSHKDNQNTSTSMYSSIDDIRQLSVSFIAQKDHLIGVLTVRESLLFASKLKNYKEWYDVKTGRRDSFTGVKTDEDFHSYVVETIISEFGLDVCSDTFVNKCSGGQAKRLSIALELVSKPRILILDEPTSGLDSSSALQVVQVLKQLTVKKNNKKSQLAIIASIHQPSARLFYEFENVYILSNDGRCLYHGSVENLLNHFSRFGLNCPKFHNPADFVIEVATGAYSAKSRDELAMYERRQQALESVEEDNCEKYKITYIVDKMTKQRFPTFLHAWLLLQRTWKNTIREPMLTWLRLFNHVIIALVASYMYDYKVGEADGCFSDLGAAFHMNASQTNSLGEIQEKFIKQQSVAVTNVGLSYFIILFLAFANSSATCLTFPLEMSVFIKERRNSWYSCGTYFMSKFISDTPFQIVIPLILSIIMYLATGQQPSWYRFGMFSLICIITASIAQGIGILFGILFLDNVSSAVFTAVLAQTPFFLLGGFLVKYSGVNILLKPIAIISYVRYCFESLVIILYGFGRCSSNSTASGLSSEQQTLADIACLLGSEEAKNSDLRSWVSELKSNSNISNILQTLFLVEESCATKLANSIDEMRRGYEESTADVVGDSVKSISLTDSTSPSYILVEYELDDHTLWTHLAILAFYIIVLRIAAYLLLLYKTNKKLKE